MPQYRKKRPVSPALYRNLYRAAYRAIRSVPENRRDKILIGETSPRGNENVVHPLAFLRGIAVPERALQEDALVRPARRPTATRTTPTRRASARASCRPTRTT